MAKTTEVKAKAMTTREFYNAVRDGDLDYVSSNGQTMISKANELLISLDKKNESAKRKAKPKVDNSAEKALIAEFLSTSDESVPAKEIALATGLTTQKVSAVLKAMVAEETVQRIELSRSKPLEYRMA